jgi:WD40 repeat protein
VHTLKGHKKTVIAAEISPDSKFIATGSYDGKIKLWDTIEGSEILSINAFERNVTSVKFSPDGKILAGGGLGDAFHLWDIASGELLKSITNHKIVVSGARYTPNGDLFISIGSESLKIWNPKSWELLKTVQFGTRYPRPHAISPDLRIIGIGFDYKG